MRCQKCANRLGSEGSPSSLKWWKICRLKVGNLNQRNCTIYPWWINSTNPRRHKRIPTMCSWQAASEARWHPSHPLSWIRPHFATAVPSCHMSHQLNPAVDWILFMQALIKMHCIELHSEQRSYGALPRGGFLYNKRTLSYKICRGHVPYLSMEGHWKFGHTLMNLVIASVSNSAHPSRCEMTAMASRHRVQGSHLRSFLVVRPGDVLRGGSLSDLNMICMILMRFERKTWIEV